MYLISIGLYEKEDMSIKAVETAKMCDVLYFEKYTSFYNSSKEEIEKFLGKEIKESSRTDLENNSKKIIEEAKIKNVGVLVVGDALSATTHNVLLLECIENGIDYKVIHGSSILTAVAESGLSIYKFGNITSIPFDNENIETPYEMLKANKEMHTLVLLDLKNEKFMTAKEALQYFSRVEGKRKEGVFGKDRTCIAFFSLGSAEQEIHAGTPNDLIKINSDKRPQCLVIAGKLNFVEAEFINSLKYK